MLICSKCAREMRCIKTGVGVRYGDSHVYPGDLYLCPICLSRVILSNDHPVNDPEKTISTLQMDGKDKGLIKYVDD